ncbi:hypothetical protein GGS20DRAFT_296466 [Poronia punctata]|nr:hypothetical protein GGS20DRAFT_296466 [Poronia punctata]
MPTSNKTAYHGQSSARSEHHYTTHPPTSHSTDPRSLEAYRLSSYKKDPHHPPMASSKDGAHIEAMHVARARQQTDEILSRLYQR